MIKEKIEKFVNQVDLASEREFEYEGEAKVLVVNLAAESFEVQDIPVLWMKKYVGGTALAARLWAAYVQDGFDNPALYEASNPVVIVPSALDSPGAMAVSIAFRSPVTGRLTVNFTPSSFGIRLLSLGYKAIVLNGRIRRPALMEIKKSGVYFTISEKYIGFRTSDVENLLKTSSLQCVMSIGPAGEQKVPFSTVVCEGQHMGRGGLGAVFGMKNIKAISISAFLPEEMQQSDELSNSQIVASCESSPFVSSLRHWGRSSFVKEAGRYGWAAVANFSKRTDPRLFHISGAEVTRRFGENCFGCLRCPILCKHKDVNGRELPSYATAMMLGPNCKTFEMETIIARSNECLDLGLDPISVGNILAWASEATSKGMLKFLEGFDFSDKDKVLLLLEQMARRIGLGEPLSFGVKVLSEAYQNTDFAYEIRALECGPYDYRGSFAQALNEALGNQFPVVAEVESHLCERNHAQWVVYNENLVLGLQSLGFCPSLAVPVIFEKSKLKTKLATWFPSLASKLLSPDLFAQCFSPATTGQDFLALGATCWNLLWGVNNLIDSSAPRIPDYFCIDPESNHKNPTVVPIRSLLEQYLKLRNDSVIIQAPDANEE